MIVWWMRCIERPGQRDDRASAFDGAQVHGGATVSSGQGHSTSAARDFIWGKMDAPFNP